MTLPLLASLILGLVTLPNGHVVRHFADYPGGAQLHAEHIADAVLVASTAHGQDPLLLTSLLFHESSFRESARSPVGATNLAQLHPKYKHGRAARARCTSKAACDSRFWSVYHGAQALSEMTAACGGNVRRGLSAYRTGRCDRVGPQTAKVMRTYLMLRRKAAAHATP